MKIAIFEPFPRTCGVTTYAWHAAQGFRDLGHDCDVVSFTKSGRAPASRSKEGGPRSGWKWYAEAADVVAPWDSAPDVLDKYDLVVLNEPRNGPLDTLAAKAGETPRYIQALRVTTTPWTTVLHDAVSYTQKAAPFLRECVWLPSFTGFAVEARPGAYRCGDWGLAGHVKKLQSWPWLPYVQRGRTPDVERQREIGIGGRMTTSKGYQALAYVAHRLPAEYPVRLFGSEAGGAAPNVSYNLYEALAALGWRGLRGDPDTFAVNYPDTVRSERAVEINNYGPMNSLLPWETRRDGHVVRYTGAYLDAVEAWTRVAVAVQLSTDKIVTTLEYTTLEAMDAGCAMILPAYYRADAAGAGDEYDVAWLDRYARGASITKKHGIRWNDTEEAEDELVHAVGRTCTKIEAGEHDPAVNRRVMDRYHAPRHVAKMILESV